MGAKTWMLVGCDADPKAILASRPELDRVASLKLARAMFPDDALTEAHDGDLSFTNPPDDEVYVGVFPGVSVIAAGEFGIDFPSKLPERFLRALPYRHVYLHAMHSVVDWFAFGIWENGTLVRSLSLSPDSGILEDVGERLAFELPFWSGAHPVDDEDDEDDYEYDDAEEEVDVVDEDVEDDDESDAYPFVFHPLELGEAALGNLFGYVLEGPQDLSLYDAEEIPLLTLKRAAARV